jgi:hypothetical protein
MKLKHLIHSSIILLSTVVTGFQTAPLSFEKKAQGSEISSSQAPLALPILQRLELVSEKFSRHSPRELILSFSACAPTSAADWDIKVVENLRSDGTKFWYLTFTTKTPLNCNEPFPSASGLVSFNISKGEIPGVDSPDFVITNPVNPYDTFIDF